MKQSNTQIIKNDRNPVNKILVATPTRGTVRIEWAAARWGQVIPCNWSAGNANITLPQSFPTGYLVAEAQNIAVQSAVEGNFEWLFLHEDDVILPPDAFVKLNNYMRKAEIPIVSGVYFLKSDEPEPLVYRGRGNSFYGDWKKGDKVWVDGVTTGCLLIHHSIFKLMWEESPEYESVVSKRIRKVFETPANVFFDPETGFYRTACGTSDLYWCDKIMKEKVLERAGWKKIAKKKYPFLCDTGIFCLHIDLSTGKTYPIGGKF